MKKWENPGIEALDISATACGGGAATEHDGCVYEVEFPFGKISLEEYVPASGATNQCMNPDKQ